MTDDSCIGFLQWALPPLHMRWPGFRKVRGQVCKRIQKRLADLNLPDTNAYRTYLEQYPSEWDVLDGFCRITISSFYRDKEIFALDRKSTLLNSSHTDISRMPSSA